MDTSSPHGHPTTRRLSDPPSHKSSIPRRQPYSPAAFTPSPQPEASENTYQRRLQLRNSAFGTQLSTQRLGARFSSIFHGNEESQPATASDRQLENRTPRRGGLRGTRSNYNLISSLDILNEISNSAHIPSLRKKASIPIYEDNPERPLLERSPATPDSQYHESSSTIQSPLSPLGLTYIQEDAGNMRLRVLSGNERRRSPSLSSPLTSATNKGRRRTTGTRQSSFEAAEYIDHIEKQLEQVKQAMHSPRSGKPIQERMKVLKAENVRLQKTVEDLESSFETRVKSSVEHMAAGEGELRRKIRSLEEHVKEADLRIEELEYEHDQARLDQEILETLKATIERLEGEKQTLEDANSSIEKRNGILTELLAFSPTKTNYGFELVSPLRNRGRLPRPVSMMGSLTKFPSPPTSKQTSRPSSVVNSPATISPGGYFSLHNVLELKLQHPCNDADSGLGQSCSAKSPITSSSRRSTLASQESTSPSAWGLFLPVSPTEGGGTIRPIQRRKPRRFMTGSTQLKPLLLPSMAAESAGLTSPRSPTRSEIFEASTGMDQTAFLHDVDGSLSSPTREVSQESMDPTTSFTSNPFEDVSLGEEESATAEPSSSPPHLSASDDFSFPSVGSASLAVELDDTTFLHDELIGDIEDETGVEEENADLVDSPERRTLFSPDQSQRSHLVFAESLPVDDPRSSPATQERLMSSIKALMHTSSPKETPLDALANPRKRRRTSSRSQSETTILANPLLGLSSSSTGASIVSSSILKSPEVCFKEFSQRSDHGSTQYRPDINPITLGTRAADHKASPPSVSSKRLSCSTSALEILRRRSTSSSPLAAATIRSIYGTLSRYTTYIREFKHDPLALARRVIANAWCSNWNRFGKLSWWVLGIFLPGGRRDYTEVAGWDWDRYDGEAVADRFCQQGTQNTEANKLPGPELHLSPGKRSVRFDDRHDSYRTGGSKTPAKPVLKGGKETHAGLGKSLYLWGKFSVAIMLAVGGAVWKGPGEMLKDCDMRSRPSSSPRTFPVSAHHDIRNDKSPNGALRGSLDFDAAEGPQTLPGRAPNNFSLSTSLDFNKTARSASSVFTFGSPNEDNFWDEDEGQNRPDRELDRYHQPDYGEDVEQRTKGSGSSCSA